MRITIRTSLYLRAIGDWKAAFEVAKLLGDTPAKSANVIRKQLLVLVGRGLAEHHAGNDTFRITDAGRSALPPAEAHPVEIVDAGQSFHKPGLAGKIER